MKLLQNIHLQKFNTSLFSLKFVSSPLLWRGVGGEVLISILSTFLSISTLYAQDTIGSEEVTIVKAYTPTLSDAFKVKEIPTVEDAENTQKEAITIGIQSVPVASTFTPSKGKAANVEKPKPEEIFKNYAALELGNYTNIGAEVSITHDVSTTDYVVVMLKHRSANQNLNEVVLDSNYMKNALGATYGSRTKEMNWNVDLGVKNNTFNWYGLPTELVTFTPETITKTDPKHTFNTIELGANFQHNESVFSEAKILFKRFSDNLNSGENRAILKPSFQFAIMEQPVTASLILDYVSGTFEKEYYAFFEKKYTNGFAGISAGIPYDKNGISFHLGASVMYSTTEMTLDATKTEQKNNVHIYPNIQASYRLNGDKLIAYAAAEGGLLQNSYEGFATENPFVSPTLDVLPTNQQLNFYGGLKGKIVSSVAFTTQVGFIKEENKALFTLNPYDSWNDNLKGYAFGNSFQMVYDNVNTLQFLASLKADFSKNVTFNLSGTFNSYTTDKLKEAWNMPSLEINSSLHAKIAEKWFAALQVFFVGERFDEFNYSVQSLIDPTITDVFTNKITLDSYFDLNLTLGYKYNKQLSAYIKGHNLANQTYQKWANFNNQGAQVLIGASYKFDF